MNVVKKGLPILICILVLGSLNSCDWVRKKMGMPTSQELRYMKAQQIQDSLENAALADSLGTQDSVAVTQSQPAPTTSGLMKRYHVIFGCFIFEQNAARMVANLPKYNLTPLTFNFLGGYTGVSGYQTDDYQQAYAKMNEFRSLDITPDDVWVYDINQRLHTK